MSNGRLARSVEHVPDVWFVLGLAMGVVVTGFCAVGSFERGADSVRRAPWHRELTERKRAVLATRSAVRTVTGPTVVGVVARSRNAPQKAAWRPEIPVFIPPGEQEDTRVAL